MVSNWLTFISVLVFVLNLVINTFASYAQKAMLSSGNISTQVKPRLPPIDINKIHIKASFHLCIVLTCRKWLSCMHGFDFLP